MLSTKFLKNKQNCISFINAFIDSFAFSSLLIFVRFWRVSFHELIFPIKRSFTNGSANPKTFIASWDALMSRYYYSRAWSGFNRVTKRFNKASFKTREMFARLSCDFWKGSLRNCAVLSVRRCENNVEVPYLSLERFRRICEDVLRSKIEIKENFWNIR